MEVLVRPGYLFGAFQSRPGCFEVKFSALRTFRPIRLPGALLASGFALSLVCAPSASAKSQMSSSTQPAKAQTSAAGKNSKKSSGSSALAAKTSPAKTAAKSHSGSTNGSHSTSAKRRLGSSRVAASKGKKPRGQQKIDSDRVQAIQEALIREHYLSGEPTGTWNQTSEDAMRHYQADHGWQSKTVPDSRALIKLGLGPSHDHLLNPESAMTTQPDMPRATSLDPVSHSANPGASVNQTPAADPVPASADPSGPQ
jgi:hypothetical protein